MGRHEKLGERDLSSSWIFCSQWSVFSGHIWDRTTLLAHFLPTVSPTARPIISARRSTPAMAAPMMRYLRFCLCEASRYQLRVRKALKVAPNPANLVLLSVSLVGESAPVAVAGTGTGLRFGIEFQASCELLSCGAEGSEIGDTGDSGSVVECWGCFSGEVVTIAPAIHNGSSNGDKECRWQATGGW